jgi:tRNA-dihydrouridine synthase B
VRATRARSRNCARSGNLPGRPQSTGSIGFGRKAQRPQVPNRNLGPYAGHSCYRQYGMPVFPFSPPAVLAPMEGITHAAQRRLLASYGPLGLVTTEFVRVSRGPLALRQLRRRTVSAHGAALSVQLMGCDPAKMAAAARLASAAGADVIDVNLGCPTRRAQHRGVGAALLEQRSLAEEILRQVRDHTPVCMSVKLRAGVGSAGRALEIGLLAERVGVDFVVVHPRTVSAGYSGVADWSVVAELSRRLRVPVVGNGDLWYAEAALELERKTGASAVMIGRPALRNPWIFRQLHELRQGLRPYRPTGADLLAHVERLVDMFKSRMPGQQLAQVSALKEQIAWLARSVPDGGAFGMVALRLVTVDQILAHARRYLSGLRADELDLDACGQFALEPRPLLLGADKPQAARTKNEDILAARVWWAELVVFQSNWNSLNVRYAHNVTWTSPPYLTIHLGSLGNAPVATVALPLTGDWSSLNTATVPWTPITGAQDVFVKFNGAGANVASIQFASPVSAPNIVPNGTFESGAGGWYTWNGTATAVTSTARAHGGLQSLVVSPRTSSNSPAATNITSIVKPGARYPFSLWVSIDSGSGGAAKSMHVTQAACCANTSWTNLSGTINVPSCQLASLQIYVEGRRRPVRR